MKKSRLFLVFSGLTKTDIRLLRKFLHSNYHNSRQDVIQLFEYLVEHQKNEHLLLKAVVCSHLFPKEDFDDRKMRHIMSFLFKAIRQFLIQSEMEEDYFQQQVWLLRALRKRGLEKEFQVSLKSANNALLHQPLRHTNFHYLNYLLHLEQYEFEHRHNRAATNLQELSDELTRFFISSELRQRCLQLSHQRMATADYTSGLLPEVLTLLGEDAQLHNQPAIALYYHGYLASIETDNPVHFYELKNALFTYGATFPQDELYDIYMLAINFCIRNINQNKPEYLREVFELYKNGLHQEVFIVNNFLSRFTYNNVVMAALGLQEWSWAESFLNDYKEKLDPKYREDSYQYNLAIYYYRKGDYQKAMSLLQTVRIDEVQKDLNIRRMLLKIYYENEAFAALESLLDSFRHFLYRHREIGYHRENYFNLIRFTRKLLKAEPYSKESIHNLRKEVETTSAVAEKKWLLQQLDKVG